MTMGIIARTRAMKQFAYDLIHDPKLGDVIKHGFQSYWDRNKPAFLRARAWRSASGTRTHTSNTEKVFLALRETEAILEDVGGQAITLATVAREAAGNELSKELQSNLMGGTPIASASGAISNIGTDMLKEGATQSLQAAGFFIIVGGAVVGKVVDIAIGDTVEYFTVGRHLNKFRAAFTELTRDTGQRTASEMAEFMTRLDPKDTKLGNVGLIAGHLDRISRYHEAAKVQFRAFKATTEEVQNNNGFRSCDQAVAATERMLRGFHELDKMNAHLCWTIAFLKGIDKALEQQENAWNRFNGEIDNALRRLLSDPNMHNDCTGVCFGPEADAQDLYQAYQQYRIDAGNHHLSGRSILSYTQNPRFSTKGFKLIMPLARFKEITDGGTFTRRSHTLQQIDRTLGEYEALPLEPLEDRIRKARELESRINAWITQKEQEKGLDSSVRAAGIKQLRGQVVLELEVLARGR